MSEDNNTIEIGRVRKRKPQILALMSLEKGNSYIHEHVDVKTGEPMKTSFAGWLAIQRQRFKKNYQGKKIESETPVVSPLGKPCASYEITVIDFDPNRKPRKPRTKKVKVEAEPPSPLDAAKPAEAPPAEAPPAEAPPAEAPAAEAPAA